MFAVVFVDEGHLIPEIFVRYDLRLLGIIDTTRSARHVYNGSTPGCFGTGG